MGKKSGIGVLLWLLPRRLRSSWLLLAITSFGILAAVTLMAIGAVYSRGLAEGGLRHELASVAPTTLDAQALIRNRPLGPADYEKLRPAVEEVTAARLGYMLEYTHRFGRTEQNLPLVRVGEAEAPSFNSPLGQPFFITDFDKHSRLVEGRWPEADPVLHDKGVDLEMVVGKRAGEYMRLGIGSQIHIFPFRTDPSERITLTVTGLAEPLDTREDYWMGLSPSNYYNVQEGGFDRPVLVPIYVPEKLFFSGLGARYPTLVGDYGWFLFLDPGVLTASRVIPTQDALEGLETDLNKQFPHSLLLTGLGNALDDYERDLTHARVPLFLFISLVVLVILYFLVLLMGLLSRTRSDEASLLRSRGASMLQVSGLLAFGEGIVVLLAIALGPFLALVIVRHLLLGTINPAGDGGPVSVGLSADMFVMGAVGGLLSLAVLIVSGAGLARLGIVEFLKERARPPTVPLIHRYYIDILVLALIGLVWWQIHDRGGFLERDVLSGALEGDISLRLGPVLVLLGAALLLLRVLPLLVNVAAWAASFLGPAWVSFALTRVARDPLPHGSLAVILLLASALGIFGATFQSTLSRSQRDQALYKTGGDLVVKSPTFFSPTQAELAGVEGVQTISPVVRGAGTLLDGLPGASTTLISLDPGTLHDTAWFRDDFADKDLPRLLNPLRNGAPLVNGGQVRSGENVRRIEERSRGIVLPIEAEHVGVWVKFFTRGLGQGQSERKVVLWMRISGVEGNYRSLILEHRPPPGTRVEGAADQAANASETPLPLGDDWNYFEAPLPEDTFFIQPPFSVVSVFITAVSRGSVTVLPPGSMGLDDVTVRGPSIRPNGAVVEGYEEAAGAWVAVPGTKPTPDTMERTSQAARSGRFGLAFSWMESLGTAPRGIFMPPGLFPLPAIGGPIFGVGQELRVRSQGGVIVPFVVRDVTDYFPTVLEPSRPFLLVSLEEYSKYVRRMHGGEVDTPSEFWVSLEDDADRGQAIVSMSHNLSPFASIQDRDAKVELAERNPLAGGGWSGLTIFSMSAIVVAVALALGIYAAVSVRSGRIDLTVARTMGLSRSQILLSLVMERVVVAVVGIAAGVAIGVWLGWWVLGFLDTTTSGQTVIPPMIVTVHEWLMVLVFMGLASALSLAIFFAALSVSRMRAADVLREGE